HIFLSPRGIMVYGMYLDELSGNSLGNGYCDEIACLLIATLFAKFYNVIDSCEDREKVNGAGPCLSSRDGG
ncbi:MAG: hypothetical protein QME71_03450, partial [Dehalococcoidia bacterium]|nr:hypothetical protein [Dehalococcoidia bacterium]